MDNYDDSHILQKLLAAREKGTAVALATIVKTRGSVPRHAGSKMLIGPQGLLAGTIGGGEMEARVMAEATLALQENRPRLLTYSLVEPERGDPGLCGGEVDIYIEPYPPQKSVLVVGGGHVGRAVAQLAHWLGFQVAVTDDREELVTPAEIPDADIYLPGSIDEALTNFTVTTQTYITALTRNVLIDRQVLPRLLTTPAPYIGVIGSRRRWQETRKLLLEDGLSESQLQRLHSPIGLELNAETPEEIAVSIMAEIIMIAREGSGARMSTVLEKTAAS